MLMPNFRPKVAPHGSRLLLGLTVRPRRRLVAGQPFSATPGPDRPALLAESEVLRLAILDQRSRFRSERDLWRFVSRRLRCYFPTWAFRASSSGE